MRGGLGQELTDGRLTVKITGAKKRAYISFAGPSARFPFQYEVAYTPGNSGYAAVRVDHFEYLFVAPSGVLATGFRVRNLKKEGNVYSDTDEPFVYEPGSQSSRTMSSRGECEELNNVCLHVFYKDGTETMFAVYIPSDKIVDKTRE